MDHKSHTPGSLQKLVEVVIAISTSQWRRMMPFSRFLLRWIGPLPRPSLDACAQFPHALKAGEWLGMDEWLDSALMPSGDLVENALKARFREGFEKHQVEKVHVMSQPSAMNFFHLFMAYLYYSLRSEVAWTDVGKGYCTVARCGWGVESSILVTSYSESGFQVCLNGCFRK